MDKEQATPQFEEDDVLTLKEAEKSADNGNTDSHTDVVWWGAGGFLILLGIIFLLNRNGLPFLGDTPWLVWLLVPIYWILVAAYRNYLNAGRELTPGVIRTLVWGIFPFLFIVAGFLIGWNLAWPIMLIAIGISLLVGRGER